VLLAFGFAAFVGLVGAGLTLAQEPTTPASATAPASNLAAPSSFDQVVERIVERERFFNEQMRSLHPLVETYIQTLKPDSDLGLVPAGDRYFLGRLDLRNGVEDHGFVDDSKRNPGFFAKLVGPYVPRFLPRGFAQMAILDSNFDRSKYDFAFVRREFLGEIRCLVIDVTPRKGSGRGRFIGRIWAEDQDYNIVRFNGTYGPVRRPAHYFHFDSWRLNMRPGMWLPAYIYSEESHLSMGTTRDLHFKAQSRLWGYNLQRSDRNDEFTQIVVDAPQQSVRDQSEAAQDATPVESQRMWERQAEDNAIERMEKVGLLAPVGEVDKVLQTVANNLIVTNSLTIQPEVRTRVLLTMPLESFTIGHTIVLSRGLLDVLPDEASLAMVISHELSHIALGHTLDTTLAFNDRMFFADENTLEYLDFTHTPEEEQAADKRAMGLLASSPYKDKLQTSALFLKVLQERAPDLKSLIRPHLGNNLVSDKAPVRMAALLQSAPQLEMRSTDQIAALPLGARVKLDPWSSRIELVKTKPVALTSAREKMPFEVTPFFPYLTRFSGAGSEKMALTAPAK
jgi:hypothetical protein